MELDDRDLRILTALQRDCRLPNAELAAEAGMSASACWRRVRALEKAGVIRAYTARVDQNAVGLGFEAIVHVQLTRHNPANMAEFIRAVEASADVQECYATTGQADYHLRVLCRDVAAYNRFLEEFLFRLSAVSSAQTNMVLRTVKRAGEVVPPLMRSAERPR